MAAGLQAWREARARGAESSDDLGRRKGEGRRVAFRITAAITIVMSVLLAAFAFVLFLIVCIGPLVAGLRRLFGARDPRP